MKYMSDWMVGVVAPEKASKQALESIIEKAKGRFLARTGAEATAVHLPPDIEPEATELYGLRVVSHSAAPLRHIYVCAE